MAVLDLMALYVVRIRRNELRSLARLVLEKEKRLPRTSWLVCQRPGIIRWFFISSLFPYIQGMDQTDP
jgi:hypothetical protein